MKFAELKANWAWMLRNMPDNEPVSFPRREAKKRVANKEKRSEVRFKCDPVTYSEFHMQKERHMRQLDENPVLFGYWLCELLGACKDEQIAAWKRIREGAEEAERPDLSQA